MTENHVSQPKKGLIVTVPISPLYCYLSNLVISPSLQYALKDKINPKFLDRIHPRLAQKYVRLTIGSALIVGGYLLSEWGKSTMRKHNVIPPHGKEVKELVTGGPFQYTRNPLYVGAAFFTFGCSIAFDNYLFLSVYSVIYLYVQFMVIPREEKGLKAFFGQQFVEYCKKVPRWLVNNWF